MEKSLREKIADLFNEAEYAGSTYDINVTKLMIWLAVMTILSSIIPVILHSDFPLIETFATLIILLLTTVRRAFRWAVKLKD